MRLKVDRKIYFILDRHFTLQDVVQILIDNLKSSKKLCCGLEDQSIDALSFDICGKMINHVTSIILQDCIADTVGKCR